MSVGTRIKNTRIDKDERQVDLANAIGCTERQIRRWEKDEQSITAEMLIAICKHYSVSADYILGLPKGLKWPR